MRRRRRLLLMLLAVACASGALYGLASAQAGVEKGTGGTPIPAGPPPTATQGAELGRGRTLFLDGCSSCHGIDGHGVSGQGPSLAGVGAAAADFYLQTGRMPLANPKDEPTRSHPDYSPTEIAALVAYVASLGPGPGVPAVDAAAGHVNAGMALFTEHCAGCHQVGAAGGIVTGAIAPALDNRDVTPREIAEAVRVGPYLMPVFNRAEISDQQLNDIVRYVVSTQHAKDSGGWGIGHIGPIPEGMIAWFLAFSTLMLVARLIGERNPRGPRRSATGTPTTGPEGEQ